MFLGSAKRSERRKKLEVEVLTPRRGCPYTERSYLAQERSVVGFQVSCMPPTCFKSLKKKAYCRTIFQQHVP